MAGDKAPLSPKRVNRFSDGRRSGAPVRRASPLRGLLDKDTSHAAGQAKKQLSQLEQMRNEVARIRQMNERDMPAIPEPSQEEPPSPSPGNSAVTSPTATPINFKPDLTIPFEVSEEQENLKPKLDKEGAVTANSPVAQRLRAWQGRSGDSEPSRASTTPSRSSSAGVAGSRVSTFVGSGDRGSNSVGRVPVEQSSGIRTVSRSSLQASTAPPRASVLSPPPRSGSRGPNDKPEGEESRGKLRNMSPLIAQRMAAFHKSR